MISYEGLLKSLWLVVIVGWACQAAFPREPDREQRAAAAFGQAPTLSGSVRAANPNATDRQRPISPAAAASICLLIESAAQAHGLPLEFFARLIWQESRFNPDAVGPTTRSGHRAQGIAQFMPETAKERGVLDPFDPVAALPKSAEFLRELRSRFGNLGLAAAAYNAGPKRVSDWLAGRSRLPGQTRHYVSAITGRSADEWAASTRRHDRSRDAAPETHTSCGELIAMLKAQPALFAGELERRVRESADLPWGVQLTAGFGRERVLAAYANLEKAYRSILENRDPIIIESKFRARGTQTFYQVRVGAGTRASADELCGALHKAGGVCLVLRNPAVSPQSL